MYTISDASGGLHGVLVFPHSNYLPTLVSEKSIRVFVTILIPLELPVPPLSIRGRSCAVLGTSVPETAVDEDGDARSRECDVDLAATVTGNGKLHAITHSGCVNHRSQRKLWHRSVPRKT